MKTEREYSPYQDEDYGKRNFGRIEFKDPWVRVYMAKLAKGWPSNMAAAAARRAIEVTK